MLRVLVLVLVVSRFFAQSAGTSLLVGQLTAAGTGGGWTSIGGPRAVTLGAYAYIGYNNAAGSEVVAVVTAGAVAATRTLHATLEIDLHDAPALYIRDSDHKLVAAYSQHDGGTLYVRVSTNSLDSDPTISGGFAAEQTLTDGTLYTYPEMVQLLSEASDPIYLFYRDHEGDTGILTYVKSTTGGASWAAQVQILEETDIALYWAMVSNGTDRIDFAISGHPINDVDFGLYHFYYEAGTYYTSSGVSMGAPPFALSDLSQVYDGSDGAAGVSAIAMDGDNPVIIYGTWDAPPVFGVEVAVYDGAWLNHHVLTATDPGDYLASAVLDPENPYTMYVALPAAGKYELFRYVSTNDGVSWTATQLTTGSADTGVFYPAMVRDYADALQVLALYGDYTSYTVNSLGIKGFGT